MIVYSDPDKNQYTPDIQCWIEWESEHKPSYFTKFDIWLNFPKYTEFEYNEYIVDLDDKWSKEATDHLIDLFETFDGNFIAVEDWWNSAQFG